MMMLTPGLPVRLSEGYGDSYKSQNNNSSTDREYSNDDTYDDAYDKQQQQ